MLFDPFLHLLCAIVTKMIEYSEVIPSSRMLFFRRYSEFLPWKTILNPSCSTFLSSGSASVLIFSDRHS
jgi:hypothetical protein